MRQFAVDTPTKKIYRKVIEKAKKQRYSGLTMSNWSKGREIIYFERNGRLVQSDEKYYRKHEANKYLLINYKNYLKGNMKNKKTTHLVKWDESSGDPIEEFSSLKAAQEFITKTLFENEDCIKDSIRIFEVKKIGKIKIDIIFD